MFKWLTDFLGITRKVEPVREERHTKAADTVAASVVVTPNAENDIKHLRDTHKEPQAKVLEEALDTYKKKKVETAAKPAKAPKAKTTKATKPATKKPKA